MASENNSLGHTWIVHGKPFIQMSEEDVFELIRENICDDCAEYVREMFNYIESDEFLAEVTNNMTDNDILKQGICSGECDKVQETQEHYESILHEIKDLAYEIYNKITEDWNPGKKRTRKEQFALDKVIVITKIINSNT